MTVTAKQIAAELTQIGKSEEKEDFHSPGFTAVRRIVSALLAGTPEFISSRPKERQMSIADWSERYGVTFKDLPVVGDDTTFRIKTDNYYGPIIQKIAVKGDNAVITLEYAMTVAVFKTRVKTEWKNVDDDTRKRVPVLDDKGQPIFETLPPQTAESKIAGKMTVPVSFFVELLNEIGRDTLLDVPPENYVPPVIGQALMNVLGAAGFHPGAERAMRVLEAMPRMMLRGHDPRDRGCENDYIMDAKDLMMHMGGYEMLGYGRGKPVPCRVFLQPDDNGRMEIIAEPYSTAEIKENQVLRGKRSQWAEWKVGDTEAVKNRLPPPISKDVPSMSITPREHFERFEKSLKRT